MGSAFLRRCWCAPYSIETAEIVLQADLRRRFGIVAGLSTTHNTLRRIGLRRRNLKVAEQDRPDVAAKGRRWRGWQRFMGLPRFVLLFRRDAPPPA